MADLITLQEYKDIEAITNTKDDAKLSALIGPVSQLVKTYCGTTFIDHFAVENAKTETFNIYPRTSMVELQEMPVNTIISVKERETVIDEYVALDEAKGEYYFDNVLDVIRRVDGTNREKPFPIGPGSVEVTYTSGYAETPQDLKLAVVALINYYHRNEHKLSRNMSGTSMNNPGPAAMDNFPPHIRRVLDLYRV